MAAMQVEILFSSKAKGLVACAEKGNPGEAYNLASGVETTIKNLAILINEIAENSTPLDLKPARDWDRSGKRFGSVEKSKKELGFTAVVEISEGVKKTVEWTLKNKEKISATMSGHNFHMKNFL